MIAFRREARASVRLSLLLVALCATFTGCGSGDRNQGSPIQQNCEEQTAADVAALSDQQMNFYRAHGDTLPLPKHRAAYLPGTNGRIVVLVHGFISSPNSMQDLGHALNDAGYGVLMPLLTGFGDGPDAANAATVDDWKYAVNQAIDVAHHCHKDVSLVAHSLGTALSTLALGDGTEKKVDRLVLLAPYFKSYAGWMKYLTDIVSTQTDTIYISAVEKYLGMDPYELFALERPANGEREPYLPLKAMRQVLSLQEVFAKPVENKLDVPVLAFVTEADTIVDGQYAATYLRNRFQNAQFVIYPAAEKIEHSFEMRSLNPNFDTMVSQIRAYLAGGAETQAQEPAPTPVPAEESGR